MDNESTLELNGQYESAEIPLSLIDCPEFPERETMDEQALAELALNIAELGLIKPLIVKPVGERFEVVAGHRRYLACTLANYTPVPCRKKVRGEVDTLAILVAENAHTEPVNPVEEARFYERLMAEKCGNDTDRLCIMLRRTRDFVEGRLLLLQGDPRVLAALEHKHITIAVARELNRVPDPNRRLIFLDVAVKQGATARQVMEWRKEAEGLQPIQLPDEFTQGDGSEGFGNIPVTLPTCHFCEASDDGHMIQYIPFHHYCLKVINGMLNRVPVGTAS